MNLKKDFRKVTWISHLILGNSDASSQLAKSDGLDIENVEISFKVNGIEFMPESFEEFTDKWSNAIEKQIKEKYDFLQLERAVTEKADELIRNKLARINDFLIDVEDQIWKLEE